MGRQLVLDWKALWRCGSGRGLVVPGLQEKVRTARRPALCPVRLHTDREIAVLWREGDNGMKSSEGIKSIGGEENCLNLLGFCCCCCFFGGVGGGVCCLFPVNA